ncbi:MAG: response regulator [Xanthomonadales bacterium]|nr:response regulator [Xanthomonadales bacterium]
MNTKPQVLVIDDDAVIGRSFDRVLSDKGYEVSTALSGEEALKDMENTDYDVVFTDIKMPGMNGIEVAERIKARCPWTPVVVITGYGTTENEARASVLGVSGFVRKPLTPEMIESVTLKALEKPVVLEEEAANEITAPAKVPVSELKGWSKVLRVIKNILMFLAAPFIALSYVIALPIVGFYTFATLAIEAWKKKRAIS